MSDRRILTGELVRLFMSVDFISHMMASVSQKYENELRDSETEVLAILSKMNKTHSALAELVDKVKKDGDKQDVTD